MAEPKSITIEDARLIWRNFAGAQKTYNDPGKRNFHVILTEQMANEMRLDGWATKMKKPREEDGDPLYHLKVTVSFKGRPPKIVLITAITGKRTILDEESCGLVDIKKVDIILNQYPWTANGNEGIAAYLKTIFVIINEDELEIKYAEGQGDEDYEDD
jgi:hypothetical protein